MHHAEHMYGISLHIQFSEILTIQRTPPPGRYDDPASTTFPHQSSSKRLDNIDDLVFFQLLVLLNMHVGPIPKACR